MKKHHKILIIYGTTGGNTEIVCQKILEEISGKNISAEMVRCEVVKKEHFSRVDFFIFASPTYGHGQLEKNFEGFVSAFKNLKLKDKPCAVVGLGDPRYDADYCCESANILSDFVFSHGGKLAIEALRIIGSPFDSFERIRNWSQNLISKISS